MIGEEKGAESGAEGQAVGQRSRCDSCGQDQVGSRHPQALSEEPPSALACNPALRVRTLALSVWLMNRQHQPQLSLLGMQTLRPGPWPPETGSPLTGMGT